MMSVRKVRNLSMQEMVGGGYGDFWHSRKRYRVVKGSRGSKKSKTAALNRIMRIVDMPQANYLCARRFGNTLRDSFYADSLWAIHRMGLDSRFHWTTSPMEIQYIPTGQKILFRGLDDGLKITSITVDKGFLCFVDIDEAFEVDESDFDKLDMAVRGVVPEGYFKQITLLFNPWSATSWLKKRFFDNPADNVFLKTSTYACNEWLDESDLEVFRIMKEKNPRRYLIEGEGEWGIAEGLIYENVEFREFDVETLRKVKGIGSGFGLDFGFTDPNAFVCLLIDNANSIIYVFDEWYKTGVTNQDIAARIIEMGYGGQRIICDSAEPKSIAELRRAGIKAQPSIKGKDSVNYGIQLIQNYKIVIHPRCVNFSREILNYCWKKTRSGDLTDEPDHEFSHGMDAMRYAITSSSVCSAPSVSSELSKLSYWRR